MEASEPSTSSAPRHDDGATVEVPLTLNEHNLPTLPPPAVDPYPSSSRHPTQTVPLSIISPSHPTLAKQPQLLDAELTDSPLLARTFCVRPSDLKERDDLLYFEYLALKVASYHLRDYKTLDPEHVTAEYWFQVSIRMCGVRRIRTKGRREQSAKKRGGSAASVRQGAELIVESLSSESFSSGSFSSESAASLKKDYLLRPHRRRRH